MVRKDECSVRTIVVVGSLAKFVAMRRASSLVSRLAAVRRPASAHSLFFLFVALHPE